MQTMSTKERFLAALRGDKADRLPVTTHHVMEYFLNKYVDGLDDQGFFKKFGLDRIVWTFPTYADSGRGQYLNEHGFICSDQWRVEVEQVDDPEYQTTKYKVFTPKGQLSVVIQRNEHTQWHTDYLIKDKSDIEKIRYAPLIKCDIEQVNGLAKKYGDEVLIRGSVPGFEFTGQPGVWQDAACLVGIERLIMMSYDDQGWVRELEDILFERKRFCIENMKGAKFDILELGGGDASSTVISPKIFDEFVAPYDSRLIEGIHDAGLKVVYHTCGGMMAILNNIAGMKPDAMETFTPVGMGGDVDLGKAREILGDKMCMIGGFDQFHYFTECSEEETRAEVRRCFEAAGKNGGFILSPSDHFFDAEEKLIAAFVDEAKKCVYN